MGSHTIRMTCLKQSWKTETSFWERRVSLGTLQTAFGVLNRQLGDMFGVSEASVCKIVTTWVCLLAKLFDGTLLRWPTREESKVFRKNTLTPELSLMQLNFPLRSPHPHVLRRPHGLTSNTIVHFNYWSELHLVELLLSSRNCGQEAPVSGRLSRRVVPLIFLRRVTI